MSPTDRGRSVIWNDDFFTRPLPDIEDLSDTEAYYYDSPSSPDFKDLEEGRMQRCTPSSTSPRLSHEPLGNNTRCDIIQVSYSITGHTKDQDESSRRSRALTIQSIRHSLYRRQSLTPPKKGTRVYRYFRWNFGSVYRRIFTLAFICNLAVLVALIGQNIVGTNRLTYREASTAASANIFVAMLIRNEHIVNALFTVFGTWPRRFPLRTRRLFAKVYSYGGIHSGCGVAGTLWHVVFVALLTIDYQQRDRDQVLHALRGYVYLVSYGTLVMLALILVFAHPRVRAAIHNWFEGIHRFLGWTVVVLFWAQTLLIVFDDSPAMGLSYGRALLVSPSFWLLLLITLLVIYPWTRLRRRGVQVELLSKHCIKLNFSYRDGHYGQAIRLSDAPLKDPQRDPRLCHHFQPQDCSNPDRPSIGHGEEAQAGDIETAKAVARAKALARQHHRQQLNHLSSSNLSNAGKTGFSVVISDAGDWTRKIIAKPPTHIYTRGVPQYGVMRIAGMFEPVIIMATGSGIAPCLALFAEMPDHPVRVI
ncbi:integral membrane protein TmpA [Pyricularia oryzae Y34]|uniref:Integral membrane protein TmpA n=2 Tax=Pyricularia oryzae TaxID=318829 RepID=A0AA97P9T1_PYRO3|nr:integral membrane protein TmpA [Pyricularia oryzae Y34]